MGQGQNIQVAEGAADLSEVHLRARPHAGALIMSDLSLQLPDLQISFSSNAQFARTGSILAQCIVKHYRIPWCNVLLRP